MPLVFTRSAVIIPIKAFITKTKPFSIDSMLIENRETTFKGIIMVEQEVVIKNRAGIHARPAALIVQTANNFDSQIFIEKETNRINGKSIMGIITLGASYKTKLKIITEGEDEVAALEALVKLFENRFEEE